MEFRKIKGGASFVIREIRCCLFDGVDVDDYAYLMG